jgi:hypothetical protein
MNVNSTVASVMQAKNLSSQCIILNADTKYMIRRFGGLTREMRWIMDLSLIFLKYSLKILDSYLLKFPDHQCTTTLAKIATTVTVLAIKKIVTLLVPQPIIGTAYMVHIPTTATPVLIL